MEIEEYLNSPFYCHHDVFVNDDGIIPTCDICGGPQRTEGDDWNGDTGNHISCEQRHPEFSEYYAQSLT